jgi:hypothetical protein
MRIRPGWRHVLACLAVGAIATTATVVSHSHSSSAQGIWGIDTCLYGFQWRDATPTDHVCVTPQRRDEVAFENQLSPLLKDPSGAWGPDSCKAGWVWREATPDDRACVTPASFNVVHQENDTAWDRRALDTYKSSGSGKCPDQTCDFKASLELAYNGAFTFKGSVTNYRTLPVKWKLACSVPTLDNKLLTISASGEAKKDQKVTFTPRTGITAEVVNHWHAIAPGTKVMCDVDTDVDLNAVVKRIQTAEKIISGIVKVVAWLA